MTYVKQIRTQNLYAAPQTNMRARKGEPMTDTTKTTDPALKNKKRKHKKRTSEKIKHHYLRTFYFSFSFFFVVFGALAVLFFVYKQDKDFFGFAEKKYEQAETWIAQEDYPHAQRALEECLELDPEYTRARLTLTDVYLKQGRYDLATDLLKESVSLQPRNENYYKLMITTLTSQNRIAEALNYISEISASYITIKLSEYRPANLMASPDPGTYDSSVKIAFATQENVQIYYTTDGSQPTKNSTRYDPSNPIPIDKGTVMIRAFAINTEGYISDEFKATYRIYNDNSPYMFVDEKMEKIVRNSINKPTGVLYYRDLSSITVLTNTVRGASVIEGQLTSLVDLEVMENLTEIRLQDELGIASFEPLTNIKTLRTLELNGCNVSDDAMEHISSLVWLADLSLDNNLISDISRLSRMNMLKTLSASGNMIKDVSALSTCTNLRTLDLSSNLISDLSALSALQLLTTLNLSDNLISDITPLASCATLTSLDLGTNLIKQLDPLSRLTKVETLILSNNEVQSLQPLATYTTLVTLHAAGTAVTSIDPLAGMTTLTTLDMSRTALENLNALTSMQVENLTLSSCGLTDISILGNVASLTMLDLSMNTIFDISALASLQQLKILNISYNYTISLLPLLSCSSLETLNCVGNAVNELEFAQLQTRFTIIRN